MQRPAQAMAGDLDHAVAMQREAVVAGLRDVGEKTGKLNRRGSRFVMWNSDKPCYDINEDPLYKSIPFFISR